jgi:shikimate dehydrogenase
MSGLCRGPLEELTDARHGDEYLPVRIRQAVDVTEPQLPSFLAGLSDEWVGLSLTMPLKQVVLPLLSSVSSVAAALGVVNTVTFDVDRSLRGDNTDVYGLVTALRHAGVSSVSRGCVVGGGATAASAVAALIEFGCTSPVVVVRSVERAGAVRDAAAALDVSPQFVLWAEAADAVRSSSVVVSTVPAGAADALAVQLADAAGLGVLLDVVYAPWPTALASAWEAAGGAVVSGFEMLLHQAVQQVRLMTGLEPPVDAMRAAAQP